MNQLTRLPSASDMRRPGARLHLLSLMCVLLALMSACGGSSAGGSDSASAGGASSGSGSSSTGSNGGSSSTSSGGGSSSGGSAGYLVMVDVTGLSGSGLVLTMTGTPNPALSVTSDGSSSFANALSTGSSYAVTVQTQPESPAQYCTVSNGSGTMGTAAVTIPVTCVNTYTVGGSITGLAASGLTLADGQETLAVANGATSFAFPQAVPAGDAYQVTIGGQPRAETCAIADGTGSVGSADVSSIQITCASECPTAVTAGVTSVLLADTVLPAGTPITTPEPGPALTPGPGGLIAFIGTTAAPAGSQVLGLYYFSLTVTTDVNITVPATFAGNYGGVLYEGLQTGGGTAVPLNFASLPGNSAVLHSLAPGEYVLEVSGAASSAGSYSGSLVFPGEMAVTSCGMLLRVQATPDALSTTTAEAGAAVSFSAALSLPDGSPAADAGGTVTITPAGSSTPACTISLSAGAGACSYTFSGTSDQAYTASYSGDANYPGGQGSAEVLVIAPFTVTDLGANATPLAINGSAQVLEQQSGGAVLYSGGTTVDLPNEGSTVCGYTAMNDLGHVAGTCGNDAVIYANGALQDIGTVGTDRAVVEAINDSDEVTGDLTTNTSSDLFLYANGTIQDLGYPTFRPYAINGSGAIVGNCGIVSGVTCEDPSQPFIAGFLLSQGFLTVLVGPSGLPGYAAGINDSGQITYSDQGALYVYSANDGSWQPVGTLGGDYSFGASINAHGEVVGCSSVPGSGVSDMDMFLYRNGVIVDVDGFISGPLAPYVSLRTPNASTINCSTFVNDGGSIVGLGTDSRTGSTPHAYLLTPSG
jgi:hypothetical protein